MLYGIAQKEQMGALRSHHSHSIAHLRSHMAHPDPSHCSGFDKAVEECKYREFAAASNQRHASHPLHARPFADRADFCAQACRATVSSPIC